MTVHSKASPADPVRGASREPHSGQPSNEPTSAGGMPMPGAKGRLLLVPNTLDLGTLTAEQATPDIQQVLPLGVLREASRLQHWVAESAKSARALLKRVDAVVPLLQPLQTLDIRELPRPGKGGGKPERSALTLADAGLLEFLRPCLSGHDVGLVSDAGLPAVADPGAALVRMAHRTGVSVIPLAGPSSLVLAVAAGGLNGQSFAFVGYLPTDARARTLRVRELEAHSRRWEQTQLMIETPYRNKALAQALLADLAPSTWLSVSLGLTLTAGWTLTNEVAAWRKQGIGRLADRLDNGVPAVFSFLAG